ncbi:tRNA lysidine(34) synthetase TilS [Zestomonas carbonaria]|uniref:tRNA(Ile)-lysidine synthase n=1 Tax=Zestomonas carbonaria TaxID=2762745 RepID=A0A7U7IAV6_9GAMM|nr:tRNA lysidine(34) synthetase TilS [Pseudomonas carbonaria]CAD5108297.1 tRNA(Ile)-lysidine synthase [Pseudomonas carbonaria]
MPLSSRLLSAVSPWRSAPAWRIALSGGLDSTVLLHLLATLARCERLPPLSAIHVHHGLQVAADAWPAHCQALCAGLGVPLQVLHVKVDGGASLERAAREARYAALAGCLGEDELLLTAQHRDDQAETLLFRLLRGAGVRGLAGMPTSRPLGRGTLLRPLLDCSRAELEDYARAQGLSWVEDPSNADTRLSRNFLRQRIMPALRERWPQSDASLARAAAHLREAQELLDELAGQDLLAARTESPWPWLNLPSLELAPLTRLSHARQRNAVRTWLAGHTRMPDSDHWAGWEALRDAAVDAQPVWRLGDGELQRADGRVWWLSGDWLRVPEAPVPWPDPSSPLKLPGNGLLSLEGVPPSGALEVRYRQGGEVLQLPGRGRRDLKRLLNEAGLPAFLRGRLPLLFRDDELLAVANLPLLGASGAEAFRLHWRGPTNDQGLS